MSSVRAIDPLSGRRGVACALATAIAAALLLACGEPASETDASPDRAAAVPAPDPALPAVPLRDGWTAAQRSLLESMSIDALAPPPADPSNRVADSAEAATLGHLLFFEPRLSSNGQVSCASCHDPERFFTDGLPVSKGVSLTQRNAPTVVGAAYSPWQFWDGRRDSLWSQALAPFESAAEMNVTRLEVVRHVAQDPTAAALYQRAFGQPALAGDPARFAPRAGPYGDGTAQQAWAGMSPADREAIDHAFANIGKTIAAYQRLLVPGPGRFDRYVRELARDPSEAAPASGLSASELIGLRLFLDAGRTQCLRCHNGPLFTNQGFHRVGTEWTVEGVPEFGRFLGIQAALVDPFNCLGAFSDAKPDACRELRFLRRDHVDAESGKFKTPTLRGLGQSAPYMHDGRFATLAAVIDHYREPPPNPPNGANGHELLPFTLSVEESEALTDFLETLDGGIEVESRWLVPPAQTGGNSQADSTDKGDA